MNSIKTTLAAFLLLSLTTLNGAFAASKYMVDSNHPLGDFLNPALALLGQGLKKSPSG
jgi:hypothetical protein